MGESTLDLFVIPDAPSLDPVTVVLIDVEQNKGKIIVECYGNAWSASFGGMGGKSIAEFVSRVDADYLSGKMASHSEITAGVRWAKTQNNYRTRIAAAVIDGVRRRLREQATTEG